MTEDNQTPRCQFCGNKLTGKQISYCSRRCKDRFWNRKKREQIEGFKALNSALRNAGLDMKSDACPLTKTQQRLNRQFIFRLTKT